MKIVRIDAPVSIHIDKYGISMEIGTLLKALVIRDTLRLYDADDPETIAMIVDTLLEATKKIVSYLARKRIEQVTKT